MLNLTADAAVWFRAKNPNIDAQTSPELKVHLQRQFRPVGHSHRARDQLVHCTQMGAVTGYNSAFRYILLRCTDLSVSEVLNRYIEGLKHHPRAWVQMQGNALDLAI